MASGLGLLRLRCTSCGECCRRLRVPITDSDLRILARRIGKDALTHCEFVSPLDVDVTGEPSSLVLLDSGLSLLVLAQRENACGFLALDARCSVYDARPAACRAYPLHASLGRRGGIRRLSLVDDVCVEATRDGTRDVARVRRDQQRLDAELTAYHARVADWNRLQRRRLRLGRALSSSATFLTYLLQQDFFTGRREDEKVLGSIPS